MTDKVTHITIAAQQAGQRIDNFLFSQWRKVPKSRIYRALRGGEVRVNKKRVKADYRLQADDLLRIPPLHEPEEGQKLIPAGQFLQRLAEQILYEDEQLLVINKPAGIAVHAGTGLDYGVIEGLRLLLPGLSFLELAHRLDRGTSGCLLVAKTRPALLQLHALLRQNVGFKKYYLAVVHGVWQGGRRQVQAPLQKNQAISGERMVVVSAEGRAANTEFTLVHSMSQELSLVCAMPMTGRTHQIRVHATHINHPIVGDPKYGDSQQDKRVGVKQIMLHAYAVSFSIEDKKYHITAPLPAVWQQKLGVDNAWLDAIKY